MGKVEAIWATPAGFVIDMDERGAFINGQPPACGAGHALSFHVKDAQIQSLVIAAATSKTQIYVQGSRTYCGPFDSQHPEEGVQLAETVTWIPEQCEETSKCETTQIEKFLKRNPNLLD